MTDSALSRSSVNRFNRSSEQTRAFSSWASTGFVRKSSAPALIPSMRSWRSDSDVTSTTGTSRVARLPFTSRHSSNPFMPGISTSLRIRSGVSSRIIWRAAVPSAAQRTVWPSRVSRPASRFRLAAISSAMRILPVSRMWEDLVDQVQNAGDLERLGEVSEGAGGQQAAARSRRGIRAEDGDAETPRSGVFPDLPHDFFPGHVEQVQIENDEIRRVRRQQLEA